MFDLKNENNIYRFDESTGMLKSAQWGENELLFDGVRFDIGCNKKNLSGFLQYDCLLNKHTWERPEIIPNADDFPQFPLHIHTQEDHFAAAYDLGPLELTLSYSPTHNGALALNAKIRNVSDDVLYLNTLTLAPAISGIKNIMFNFPANVPGGNFDMETLKAREPISAGLVNFAIHTQTPKGKANILFIDNIEKWGTAVWHDDICSYYAYSAALEADLPPNTEIEVGTLYIQPCSENDPYLQIRAFTEALGYHAVTDGIRDGVMYSCHPYGTMDSCHPQGTLNGNFSSLQMKMAEFARFLPGLKEMGIDHVWLLPIFEHYADKNPYHSTDQAIIDERYGSDEDVRNYCDKAHDLGLTVLFDYVPHGPAPELPLAKNNPDWCAKRRDGSLQDEWECVSMDYNHPGYLEYTTDLVKDHVKRFGIDGARIDCAMGGLSNWRPYGNNRPSASSVRAGVNISDAIRLGFTQSGKKPLSMPENFNPIPPYFYCTDVFYGMTLYRMLDEHEKSFHDDPTAFVGAICTWLEREKKTLPEGLVKLRFLGNHDTVSWVWQKRRATAIYGTEGAKAMWAFISLIDGMPMIYQGDEDPSLYCGQGPELFDFFKSLFADRKKWLCFEDEKSNHHIEYIETNTPIAAFYRSADKQRLVLINFDKNQQTFDISKIKRPVSLSAGEGQLTKDGVIIPPYRYAILSLQPA